MTPRLGILVALFLLPSSCLAEARPDDSAVSRRAVVVSVHDGDTITVELGGRRERCRLLGIDAPELCYARVLAGLDKIVKYESPEERREIEAAIAVISRHAERIEVRAIGSRDSLAGLVMKRSGRTVRLTHDSRQSHTDRYGRLLVYVDLGGVDVNAEMVRRGLAVADERFPCDRLEDYVRHQRTAEASRVGLWAAPDGTPGSKDESGRKIKDHAPPADPRSRPRGSPHSIRRRYGPDVTLDESVSSVAVLLWRFCGGRIRRRIKPAHGGPRAGDHKM